MANLTDLFRRLALMQHLGEEYFIIEDTAYEGNEKEARAQFEAEIEGTEDANFEIFCSNNLTQVEELEENDYDIDYMVLTDEEANQKWEESLDSYLEDIVYPELPEYLRNYFDEEKWKYDARMDGRGHSLSPYDGNESEETVEGETFYIYRTN